jgi:hypothetical protein
VKRWRMIIADVFLILYFVLMTVSVVDIGTRLRRSAVATILTRQGLVARMDLMMIRPCGEDGFDDDDDVEEEEEEEEEDHVVIMTNDEDDDVQEVALIRRPTEAVLTAVVLPGSLGSTVFFRVTIVAPFMGALTYAFQGTLASRLRRELEKQFPAFSRHTTVRDSGVRLR